MNYSKEFENLIETSIENNQYIGLGCPNAKILFIGKEAKNPTGSEMEHGSAQSWKSQIDYSKPYELKQYNPTWRQYQKLYDIILSEQTENPKASQKDEYNITFVENVFTTELSIISAPTTTEAKKQKSFESELKKRKDVFRKSKFIQQFPIVVIFASDNKYIETYPGEVQELFDVEFHELITLNKSNKLWIHYASEKAKYYPKLVIHTRQLINGALDELLENIGKLISHFAKDHSINVKVKGEEC